MAILHAIAKLIVVGDQLSFPHSSAVKGSSLRERRPRQGRSRWRPLYRRSGEAFIIAAIAPEAQIDRRDLIERLLQQRRGLNGLKTLGVEGDLDG